MACTGELPPNTRSGQSFIHDPKASAAPASAAAHASLRPACRRGPMRGGVLPAGPEQRNLSAGRLARPSLPARRCVPRRWRGRPR